MRSGYLATVDYRMLVDNIDWDYVESELAGQVSVKELNQRLFVPERDEAVAAKIEQHLREIADARCVIFCRSIAHAESLAAVLQADGVPLRVMHSKLNRFETTHALREFRSGAVPVIVTVDMLNEGIDVPDVNLIVFLRVTHSRRIFVQQLGRGLRMSPGKSQVRVLDFVSDIRRIAAGLELNREADAGEAEPVLHRAGHLVKFEGDEGLRFFDEYLADVAELEDASDEVRLKFPVA
jgi:superfamily II DNA or RNA helicase